ncbi:MAG: hypothetical protein PHO03_02280 [Candidatus Omnitrophica bacterium]|nr:hypothetical protein [Candidatus Omnitrophota bacterium]
MKRIADAVKEIRRETEQCSLKTRKVIEYVYTVRGKDFSILSAALLINKNINTCEVIVDTLDDNNLEEASVLMRFLLERISLAFKISKDKINIQHIGKLKANSCIAELKNSFDFLGLLYGHLSRISHSHFWTFANNFVKFNKSKNKSTVRVVLYKDSKELSSAYLGLFMLVFLNLAVAEFIEKEYSKGRLFHWELNKNLVWKCSIIDELILWKVNNWFVSIDGKPLFN